MGHPERHLRPAGLTGTHDRADGLIPIDCSEEDALQSIEAVTNTSITFINISGEVRKRFWLDYNGNRQGYGTSQPDDQYVQGTFVTHPWVITDEDDDCIQILMPAEQAADAYLN